MNSLHLDIATAASLVEALTTYDPLMKPSGKDRAKTPPDAGGTAAADPQCHWAATTPHCK